MAEIQRLTPKNAKQVNALLKQTVRESLSSSTTEEGIRYYTDYYSTQHLREISKDAQNLNFVLLDNKKVVGGILSPCDGGIAFLHFVFIEPGHRSQGLGKKLLLYYIEQCRNSGCRKIELFVNPEAPWKIRVYKRLGFKKIYKKKKMWFNQDVVYMLKDLFA